MITFETDGKTLNAITPGEREWALFFIFGVADGDQDPEDWDTHVDWLMARFADPDAWLGDEGDAWRANLGWNNPSGEFVRRWHRFNAAHAASTTADIDKLLGILLHDA